jgi:hypothetical protein
VRGRHGAARSGRLGRGLRWVMTTRPHMPAGRGGRRRRKRAALEDWYWAVLGRKVGCAAEQES